jgi:maleylpyruvate isomerase
MSQLVLHNYFRSSTSIRVRIALNLKGLSYDYVAHHLRKGEHHAPAYLELNPQGLVPVLVLENGAVLAQSLAIIEYLEERFPEPALLPPDAIGKARIRALAYAVAYEIHPINNLRVLNYLKTELGQDESATVEWFKFWVATTFEPLEKQLATAPETGRFCHGDTPTLADICLFAQVVNNRRFNVDMAPYPTIRKVIEACSTEDAFLAALPERQPDAE